MLGDARAPKNHTKMDVVHVPKFILLDLPNEHVEEGVKAMAVEVYRPFAALRHDDLTLRTFDTGWTNRLYRLTGQASSTSTTTKKETSILVRIYGNDTHNFIDR
jgi:hypothetical protein